MVCCIRYKTSLSVGVYIILQVHTRPSLGKMLVRWTTSRWADWDTKESDDREMMWSHIPAKVLHWRRDRGVMRAEGKKMTGKWREESEEKQTESYWDWFWSTRDAVTSLQEVKTEIISSDCSTSPLPSVRHTNCFLSQWVHRHGHEAPSQTEAALRQYQPTPRCPCDIF